MAKTPVFIAKKAIRMKNAKALRTKVLDNQVPTNQTDFDHVPTLNDTWRKYPFCSEATKMHRSLVLMQYFDHDIYIMPYD